VHINCYRCGKEYFVQQENLSPPKLVSGKGYGWWMSCSHCDYEWWQGQPIAQVSLESRMRATPPPVQGAFLGYDLSRQLPNHMPGAPLRRGGGSYLKTSRTVTVLWLCFFLSLLTVFGLGYQYQNQIIHFFQRQFFLEPVALTQSEKPLFQASPSAAPGQTVQPTAGELVKQAGAAENPLSLENVKYGIQTSEAGEKSLVILGEVFNGTTQVTPLSPLKIVGFGPCIEGETPQTPAGLCVRAEWTYSWSRPNVLPGERLFFQADKPLEVSAEIQRVEVTIP
jgi:hypothetical protein